MRAGRYSIEDEGRCSRGIRIGRSYHAPPCANTRLDGVDKRSRQLVIEPAGVCRRPFGLGHAITSSFLFWAEKPGFTGALDRRRPHIKQAVGKLKRVTHIALHSEKTARIFGSFGALATAFSLLKSVHTAAWQ